MTRCPFPFLLAISLIYGTLSQAGEPQELLRKDFVVNGDAGISVVLHDGAEFATKQKYSPPLRITYRMKTDNDIRLSFGADQIIFNWGMDHTELRIDGGPANKQHVKGGGQIPKNEWITIVQLVTPDSMSLAVNGAERARWEADFSKVRKQIRLFPHRSNITLQSIRLEKIDPMAE
jgi:hypothetical protein